MLGKSHLFLVAFSAALGAQSAWTGLPPVEKNPLREVSNARASLALIPLDSQYLGEWDGGSPLKTAVQVMNVGTGRFKLIAPTLGGIARTRIQIPVSGDLELAPGEVFQIPIEYDARLDSGSISFEVAFRTTDPEAPVLRQTFQAVVRQTLSASPYRDCLQGQLEHSGSSRTLPISFNSGGTERFQGVSIEDSAAPVLISGTVTKAGDYVGTLSLDWTRIQSGKSHKCGETRVFGTTQTGRQTYIWIQWFVR